ncbi:MAG: hypothetical protein RL385_4932, partial [Pseudomonadota bacterium]
LCCAKPPEIRGSFAKSYMKPVHQPTLLSIDQSAADRRAGAFLFQVSGVCTNQTTERVSPRTRPEIDSDVPNTLKKCAPGCPVEDRPLPSLSRRPCCSPGRNRTPTASAKSLRAGATPARRRRAGDKVASGRRACTRSEGPCGSELISRGLRSQHAPTSVAIHVLALCLQCVPCAPRRARARFS